VTYYVAGAGSNVRVFEAAKPVAQWDPEHPDENTDYYARKLDDLCRKFLPLIRGEGSIRQGELPLGD